MIQTKCTFCMLTPMFTHMFTPCSYLCLHHVDTYVYTMFTPMLTIWRLGKSPPYSQKAHTLGSVVPALDLVDTLCNYQSNEIHITDNTCCNVLFLRKHQPYITGVMWISS